MSVSGRRWRIVMVAAALAVVASCRGKSSEPAPRPRVVSAEQQRMDDLMRQNETRPSDPALAQAYNDINGRYFGSRLPPIRIRWDEGLDAIGALIAPGFRLEGLTNGKVILLHPSLEKDARQFSAVLCHEMVHVELRDRRDVDHGPEFQSRLRALADGGAFEGVIASEEEKRDLKRSLDERAARLGAELTEIEQVRARLEAAAPTLTREALQDQTWAFNTRVRRHNEDADEYNRLVGQYNLMIAYPDGLDRERLQTRTTAAPAG